MRTALITGANGFCGVHLARRLRQEPGTEVIAVDVKFQGGNEALYHASYTGDVCSAGLLRQVLERHRPQWVFHLAGLSRGTASVVYENNLVSAITLLECVKAIVPQAACLLVGSAAEYGALGPGEVPVKEDHPCRPCGPYAISKHAMVLAGLDYARSAALRVFVARPFNVVGAGVPPSLVVGAILERAKQALAGTGERVVSVGNLSVERDFIAVQDVVEAYLLVMKQPPVGEVVNICSGVPRSVNSVIKTVLSHAPMPILLKVDPQLVREGESPIIYGSTQKARRLFGFEAKRDIDVALREAWEHTLGGRTA
jgi:GDP-4-dehydro-6-deoxy-D-mannose reductase